MSSRDANERMRETRARGRGPGRRGYSAVGYAVIALVVILIAVGTIVLASMIGSSSADDSAGAGSALVPTGVSSTLSCPSTMWPDTSTGTCVRKTTCLDDAEYDEATNTCVLPLALAVLSLDPAKGPVAGGTEVTITGTLFADGATVTIDSIPATDVAVVNDTTITAVTPKNKHDYPVDVVVTNPNGSSATLNNGFAYVAPPLPRITSIRPDRGSKNGGETVILKGAGFVDGASVAFGGVPAESVTIIDRKTMQVSTPAGASGPVDVSVVVPGRPEFTRPEGFTYSDTAPRAVEKVSPRKGSDAGGTAVAITGSGFLSGATVTFDGRPASNVRVVGPTTITAVTPSGSVGKADVAVTNPGVPAATLSNGFEYVPAARVVAVRPGNGPASGGTQVVIIGTGFVKGTTVTIDGQPARDVTVVSPTAITATIPAGATGPADVAVKLPAETPVTLAKGFVYLPDAPATTP